MDEMLKIPGCANDNASQLRAVYDRISINIRGLESLGVSSNQYGSLLIPVIMSKMPPKIRVQIARNTVHEVWDMSELLEVIRQEVEAREVSDGVKTNVNLDKPKQPQFKLPPTANALVSMRKNFNFIAFIAMGSITQPPARKFECPKIERKFYRRIIVVLFASRLGMG